MLNLNGDGAPYMQVHATDCGQLVHLRRNSINSNDMVVVGSTCSTGLHLSTQMVPSTQKPWLRA